MYFADEQSAGRDAGAHGWASPPGSGLYVSMLLRPQIAPADIFGFRWRPTGGAKSSSAGDMAGSRFAVAERFALGAKEILRHLTELNAEVTRVRHAVMGIGINVHQERFPNEILAAATSLFIETDRNFSRQELLIALLQSLDCEVLALTCDVRIGAGGGEHHERLKRVQHGYVASGVGGRERRIDGND